MKRAVTVARKRLAAPGDLAETGQASQAALAERKGDPGTDFRRSRHFRGRFCLVVIAFSFALVFFRGALFPAQARSAGDNTLRPLADSAKPRDNAAEPRNNLVAESWDNSAEPAHDSSSGSWDNGMKARFRVGAKVFGNITRNPANLPGFKFDIKQSSNFAKSYEYGFPPRVPASGHPADDSTPLVYKAECRFTNRAPPKFAGRTLRAHFLTDVYTLTFWWHRCFFKYLIDIGVLEKCGDADFGTKMKESTVEAVFLMYNMDLWLNAQTYTKAILNAVINRQSLRIFKRDRSMLSVGRVMVSPLIQLRRRVVEKNLPVISLFSENPDYEPHSVANFLHLMRYPLQNVYFLTYRAGYASQDGYGHVEIPTADNEISSKLWDVNFRPEYGPGKPFHIRTFFWHSYWWDLVRQMKQRRADDPICADGGQGKRRHAKALSSRTHPALILGGDDRAYRTLLLFRLFKEGLLGSVQDENSVLWSLQIPFPCCEYFGLDCKGHGSARSAEEWEGMSKYRNDPDMKAFCALFPKNLDIKLDALSDSEKDRLFPPQDLYDQSRFSVTFESCDSFDGYRQTFLTEKILKPIYGGHPFIILCGSRGGLDLARSFGFKTFSSLIDESYQQDDQIGGCCLARTTAQIDACAARGVNIVKKLLALAPERWDSLSGVVAHNQRHLRCGGLEKVIEQHSFGILNTVFANIK